MLSHAVSFTECMETQETLCALRHESDDDRYSLVTP